MNIIKRTLLALLLCAMSAAHATSIGYTATALGGTQWRYDYTVSNTTLAVPIEEFTIFFSVGPYLNLLDVSTAPGWDLLLVQPDPAIPDSGYLDALALAGGIAPGASAAGFSVTFDYLGTGSPGSQLFAILDPLTFVAIDTGGTQAVPLPSTPCLLLAGMLAMLCLRRRQLAAAVLALGLCACGGANDPTQPPTPKVKLAAAAQAAAVPDSATQTDAAPGPDLAPLTELTRVPGTPLAAGPFTVTALRKAGERRISRRIHEYTFRISIRNNGSEAASNVHAVLASVPAGASIVDDSVLAGGMNAGATVTPDDTITLRIDRTRPFELGGLVWDITAGAGAGVALDPVRPAEVVSLPLAELGFPDGADSVKASGAVTDVLLKDGSLRFSTPGDTGEDQHAQFFVTRGNSVTALDLLIQSELPTALRVYVEPLENGSLPPAPPKLAISGLGPNNTLQPGGLSFRLEGVAPLDLKNDSGGFLAAQSSATVAIHSYWIFHADTGSFSISATAMQQLLNALPAGALQLQLNFVTQDGEFAASYALTVIKAATVLKGQMRTPAGGNASGLAGKKILLTGYNFHLRRVAVIDAAGAFSFDGVIPDTYQLTLNDLDHPNVVGISAAIFPTSTIVNVSIVYPYATAPGLQAAMPWSSAAVTQDGAAPPVRQAAQAMAGPPPDTPQDEDGTQSFTATAGPQNQTVVRPISYTVPTGTQHVGVKITVRTAEYPTYTTQQSQYNDTWSYVVVGLPGVDLASMGAVNQSHFTQGTTVRTECVDVGKATMTGPLVVTGAVSATNIGDNLLATLTTVELSLACNGLKITRARFFPINADLHPVLQPRNLAYSLPGPYVSVPQETPNQHSISLEVRYSPEQANLTEVHIGMSANGANPAFSTVNLLKQANIQAKGRITFPRLSLPDFPGAKFDKKVVLTVRLKGRIGNADAASDPAEGGQVALKGDTAFIPLYLAHNEAALAKRRYGPRDDGGDSWATRLTIAWLEGKPYRFNDISAQHVTQQASGRSILEHDGHSDGQQIDMRYADGAGGYSDELGGLGDGAAILQLINDAQAEVAAGLPKKPKLARLGAWITANRAMLTLEAGAASTRVVYIGHRFIKLALIDGRFAAPPHARIPGVAVWAKPVKLSIDPSHLHHWHLSMTAHP